MNEILNTNSIVGQLTIAGLLVVALLALLRRVWVPGSYYQVSELARKVAEDKLEATHRANLVERDARIAGLEAENERLLTIVIRSIEGQERAVHVAAGAVGKGNGK